MDLSDSPRNQQVGKCGIITGEMNHWKDLQSPPEEILRQRGENTDTRLPLQIYTITHPVARIRTDSKEYATKP